MALDLSPYIPLLIKMDINVTNNINHVDCPAGKDTRKRLYLTRKDNQVGLGYCHNCGEGGMSKLIKFYREETPIGPLHKTAQHDSVGCADYLKVVSHTVPITWEAYNRASLKGHFIYYYNAGCRSDDVNIYYPIYSTAFGAEDDTQPLICGYQKRKIELKPKGSKYLTYITQPNLFQGFSYHPTSVIKAIPVKGIVITEDMVSAQAIAQLDNYEGVAALGTKHSIEFAYTIFHEFLNGNNLEVFIWYDNDKPEVIKASERLKDLLKMLAPHCRTTRIDATVSPKYYITQDIQLWMTR